MNPDYKAGVTKLVHKKNPEKPQSRFMVIKPFKSFLKTLQKIYVIVLLMPAKSRLWVDLAEEIWLHEGEFLSSIFMIKDINNSLKRKTLLDLNPVFDEYNVKDPHRIVVLKSFNEDIESDPSYVAGNGKKTKTKWPKNLKIKEVGTLTTLFPYSRMSQPNFELVYIPHLRFKKLKEVGSTITQNRFYSYLDCNYEKLGISLAKLADASNNRNGIVGTNLLIPDFESIYNYIFEETQGRLMKYIRGLGFENFNDFGNAIGRRMEIVQSVKETGHSEKGVSYTLDLFMRNEGILNNIGKGCIVKED